MFTRQLLALALLSACTGGTNVNVRNSAPTATITSHEDGDVLLEGREVSLVGRVSDVDDNRSELVAGFEVGGIELCPKGPPGDGGEIRCQTRFVIGEKDVALIVVDPNDATGEDRVRLTVQSTEAPVVTWTTPLEDGTYYADEPIALAGTVADSEDQPQILALSLRSDLDGDVDGGIEVGSDGSFSGELELSEGRHALTLEAVDSDGKTGLGVVRITVLPPNTTPECAAISETGSSESGLAALLEVSATDADQDNDTLDVQFQSDRDGDLGTVQPDAAGRASLSTTSLTDGAHVVTVTVTDNAGDTCSDTIRWAVGQPPDVSVSSPVDGSVISLGEELVFEATVSDPDDPETDLVVRVESDRDGELASLTPDSTGAVGFRTSTLSRGSHVLSLRAEDPVGLFREVRRSVRVNGPPTAPTVALIPDPADATEDLSVSITLGSTDPDGDTVSYTYAWSRDGTPSSASTTDVLPASATSRGEVWSVQVTPFDGRITGPSGTAALTIANTPPTTGTPTLSPASPKTGESVQCLPTGAADIDGDTVTHSFSWSIGGTASAETTDTLAASETTKGDSITCTATPNDGTIDGIAQTSAASTVVNTAPTLGSVAVSPTSPTADETLTCTPMGATDDDGDSITYTYAWTIAGTSVGTASTLSGAFDKGDSVTCTATPDDGTDSGTAVDATVTIVNKAPSLASAAITPSGATTEDALTCTPSGGTDIDGDTITYTYDWTIGGTSVGTGATLAAGIADKGDSVTCAVTPSDGTAAGTAVSASITIANAEPTVTSVSISPASPTVSDALTCGYILDDPDGDTVTASIGWTSGTTLLGTGATLSTGYTKGDSVTCTVTPDDGTDTGTSDDDTVTIGNAAPTSPTVTFSPTEWIVGQTTATALSCVATGSTDADGDTLINTYTWYVNSTKTTTSASLASDLDPSDFSAEDEVECEVSVSDGTVSTTGSATIDIFEQPDWGAIQFPCSASETTGSSLDVYGRVYMLGVTEGSGQGAGITAEAGIGPDGSDPTTSLTGWTFTAGTYNADLSNDDEYKASLTVPSTVGSYDIAWRFSADGGLSWIYVDQHSSCGTGLSGYTDGYSASNSTPLTVTSP